MPRSLDVQRADARSNRDRILRVAHEAFAESADVSLNSIAKRAGVGAGTLYRHFPNREALVVAVYRHDVEQLAESAARLLEEHPPIVALQIWFERLAQYGRIKRGLAEVIHAASADGLAGETYGPVITAIADLLESCERDGAIRAGLDPDDILLLMGFLWRLEPDERWERRAHAMIGLVIDGMRVQDSPR
jgi:AcrR family transcriptional regulator